MQVRVTFYTASWFMATISSAFPSKAATGMSSFHTKPENISHILKRRWLLPRPDTRLHPVFVSSRTECDDTCGIQSLRFSVPTDLELVEKRRSTRGVFYIIRDDLLHPIMGGNKLRKLDALLPVLQSASVTDVVTCGGCQSAHTAALAVACAENGIRAHLLLRGERLSIPTGYNLISGMYGEVTYISRSDYADREAILTNHANIIADGGSVLWMRDTEMGLDFGLHSKPTGPIEEMAASSCQHVKKVAVVKEGASNAIALLGLVRLVDYLSHPYCFGRKERLQLVVDSGTGTTAIGLAVGILILGLPWEVVGVTLAGDAEAYKNVGTQLLLDLNKIWDRDGVSGVAVESLKKCLSWVERQHPRKFGKVCEGEIKVCRRIAQETGILLDPIYTLAAWEVACELSLHAVKEIKEKKVVVLHTGGTMGLFGLAQRYPTEF